MGHWEDFWWEISAKIKKHRLQKKFDMQLEKMKYQDKHKYKDTRQLGNMHTIRYETFPRKNKNH